MDSRVFISPSHFPGYESWPIYLLVPLACCVLTGVSMTVLLRHTSWRASLCLATVVDAVILVLGVSILHADVGMIITTLFAAVASAALCLPHVLQADVSDGCIINLRIFTGLSVTGVLIYIMKDATSPAARSAGVILFTAVMSIGLLLGELGLARHVQAKSTGLSQQAVLYSGAGVLTLAVLVGSLGPIAAGASLLIVCAVMAFVLMP